MAVLRTGVGKIEQELPLGLLFNHPVFQGKLVVFDLEDGYVLQVKSLELLPHLAVFVIPEDDSFRFENLFQVFRDPAHPIDLKSFCLHFHGIQGIPKFCVVDLDAVI